jgi:2-dehydropantoate 2-reductase
VAAATIRIGAARAAPGVIVETGAGVLVELASDHPAPRPRMAAFTDLLRGAEVPARLGDTEAQVLWSKLVMINALACTTTAYDAAVGPIRDHPRRRLDLEGAIDEAAAVAGAEGATIDTDAVTGYIWRLDPDHTTSMQRDVADGEPPELDAIPGGVLRHAAAAGLSCPTIERLVAMIEARLR